MKHDHLFVPGTGKFKIPADILKQRQALPLDVKVLYTKRRIREFYYKFSGKVYVCFSGGKDSTVLLHIAREIFPDIPALFVDTGLEYPEIKEFVRNSHNIEVIRPKKSFIEILEEYGYPVINKQQSAYIDKLRNGKLSEWYREMLMTGVRKDGRKSKFRLSEKWKFMLDAPFKISDKCCDYMKKEPFKRYQRKTGRHPIMGTMAADSQARKMRYMEYGCNVFNSKFIKSTPIGFWRTEDVWQYIKTRKVAYCKIYDTGVHNTGCIFCMFGVHMEKELNRFQLLQKTHPQLHNYCINTLGLGKVLRHIGVPYTNTQEKLEKFK